MFTSLLCTMEKLTNYRGNKGVQGLYQFIINRIPACDTFYEAFAGSAMITEKVFGTAGTDNNDCMIRNNGSRVRPVINDCSGSLCLALREKFPHPTVIYNLPAVQLLSTLVARDKTAFVYCDPPYLISTRGSSRRIYKHEMSEADHIAFLSMVHTAAFNCMISHYDCKLYNRFLKNWNKEKFLVSYHGKVVEECIYYNYNKPSKLLTYKYVGSDCWDRQRVTRKINRLVTKLNELPELERNAVISRVTKSLI